MKKNKILLIELIVALLCSFKIVNYSLVNIFPKIDGSGYLNILFITCTIIYVTIKLIKILKNKNKLNKKIKISFIALILITYILISFLLNNNKSSLTFIELVCYCFFPIFIGIYEKIEFEKVIKYIMVLSLLPLLCFNKLFVVQWYGSINMDISYAFLPTICASLIHFVYYRDKSNKNIFVYILYLINFFYLWQIILYGERGTLVCIFSILLLCFAFKQNNNKIIFDKRNSIRLFSIFILLFVFLLFYKNIIELFIRVTGINSYAFNKTSILSSTDISNGRFDLYKKSILGFLNHPLLGNGISSFSYYYHEEYPHNIFLQLLFDGGLTLFMLFIYILIFGCIKTFKGKDKNNILVNFFFFSVSILYLSFSNDIWLLPALWFYIGFLIKMLPSYREVGKNENIN